MEFKGPLSRRSFLSTTARLAAVGSVAGVAPGLLRAKASGAPLASLPDPKGNPIEHVVVLMMENRSFDHYFGSLALTECRPDVRGLSADMANVGADGRSVKVFKMTDYCQELDPPHGFTDSKIQYADGTNSGYLRAMDLRYPGQNASNDKVMGHYDRSVLPFSYGVADEYAICDRYFSSHGGSTFPNRHYMAAAQSFGITDNRFSPDSNPGNPIAGFANVTTIFHRLNEKGVKWAQYFFDVPFNGLYSDLRTSNPDSFRPIEALLVDAATGNLPSYVQIDPPYLLADDHPSKHVQLGQFVIAAVYNILSRSPVWEKTALFVNYDEDGGFFDHVPHQRFPDDRASADPAKDFGKSGGRIPGMVLSPWVKKRYVYKEKVCHASVLGFAEWRFGLRPMTLRDAGALAENRIFLDAFDFVAQPRPPVDLPVPAFDPASLDLDCFGGNFQPDLPQLKPQAHDELMQAADAGALGNLDQRDRVRERFLRAVDVAKAGNGGTPYVASASCATVVAGETATRPSPGGSPPPAADDRRAKSRLAATGEDERLRLGLGTAALGGAAGAALLRRRLAGVSPEEEVSPR